MKTAELTGAALDWAVAQATEFDNGDWLPDYSTEWCHGGAIIESELIDIFTVEGGTDGWQANKHLPDEMVTAYGETPLIAAMRCYVASKLGDEVEVPEELMTNA